MPIAGVDPDGFATRDQMVDYFVAYADQIAAPIRCGVAVTALHRKADGTGFRAETSAGAIEATNVVAATGPFQRGDHLQPLVPPDAGIVQTAFHRLPQSRPAAAGRGAGGRRRLLGRADRRRTGARGPARLPVASAGTSGRRDAIAARDFCWWLGVLGLWDAEARDPSEEHVTIAVSGAYGGHTIDFRRLAGARGDAAGPGGRHSATA